MIAAREVYPQSEALLQLLLFVDKRPSSREHIQRIRHHLQELHSNYTFDLRVVDVGESPYLAEHFKLVATPSLVKIHPEPRQTLAGTNLVEQLDRWWPKWQQAVEVYKSQCELNPSRGQAGQSECTNLSPSQNLSVMHSAEIMRMSDEIFRLKQEKAELQQQLQLKERLIAMLAHDLRNPLTAISIALETLQTHLGSGEEPPANFKPSLVAQLVKHARTQTKNIERMISDLLQTARNAEQPFQLQRQKCNLKQLCEEVIEYFQERCASKSQYLQADLPNDLPLVKADPERVRQVLTNLIDNAIKYTPENGVIQVAALHRTTRNVQISVCDNGFGIPPENQKHIFEDRFRLQRDQEAEGYGIGLSLCQRLIRAHYGEIWVDSVPNQGSCFHFTLPVYGI
ncbi:histidine kinase [Geitlerinema sp. PCC 9228]|jgi:two-component system clock-associated histidine kinase SasA|uniref:histidine kinase n=1 Tax=Geitlerinema sp. PCC 9228 TaxID=111611 RepID=UPI0008F9A89B|nr:histidine kinase [Geitlerinema sp. PCC 9228]